MKVWPAAMLVNFRFVPVDFQVLYINCVVLGWSAYLSWKVNKEKALTSSHA